MSNTHELEAKLADLTAELGTLDAERARVVAELSHMTTAGDLDALTALEARRMALERLSAERTRSTHETRAALDVARREDARELVLARLVVLSKAMAGHRAKHDAVLDRIAAAVAPEVARLTDTTNEWDAARREAVELLRGDLGVMLGRGRGGDRGTVNAVLSEISERGGDVGALREVRGWITPGGALLDVAGPAYDPAQPLDGRTLAVEGVWARIAAEVWRGREAARIAAYGTTYGARMAKAAEARATRAAGPALPADAGRPSGRREPVYDALDAVRVRDER